MLCYLQVIVLIIFSCNLSAKTNEPLYEDAFDLGGGGAVLTRATQEAILFSNPAMLPYGGKVFRWAGLKTTVAPGKDSLDLAKAQATSSNSGSSSDSQGQFLDTLFAHPVHIGVSQTLSLLTSGGGLAFFASTQPDLRAYKFGEIKSGGTPSIEARTESYSGFIGSLATRSYWSWLSFGMSTKYLFVDQSETILPLTDKNSVTEAQKKLSGIKDTAVGNTGFGGDVSSLMFFQGKWCDLRIGSSVLNIGGMKLVGTSQTKEIKQTVNAGLGLTFHSTMDALHFSVDYRDIDAAYGENLFKRIYVGTKILIRTYLGFSAGYYQGNPTYGTELDFYIFRLGASMYTRVYGASPKAEQRTIYVASFATGFSI